jgi:predicted dehydrogenase
MLSEKKKIDRREFLDKSLKVAAVAGMASVTKLQAKSKKSSGKIRVAMVGTGIRGIYAWGKALIKQFPDKIEFVALCDINIKRAKYAGSVLEVKVPIYHSGDFDKMIKKNKPDIVIVTTTDAFHSKYVVRAMELGCDVISEKPLVIEREQAQAILDAEAKSGKKLIVGFNARYENGTDEIKKIVMSGELGRIISVDFQEYLDTSHGASYYRRWHRFKRYSGTLLLHKSVHHFDKMNWIIDAEPQEVQAFGKLDFYGKNSAMRARNCRVCPFKTKCKFYWDITKDKGMMDLYVNNEDVDGYLRDGCVFDSDIDIYDSMSLGIKYKDGVLMNYSINTFMPYEGQHITINGSLAKLDVELHFKQPWEVKAPNEYRLSKLFGETRTWSVKNDEGTHGGADEKLRAMIFDKSVPDPLNKRAGSRAGVLASLMGIAARESIESGERIKIADMVKFPHRWDWK